MNWADFNTRHEAPDKAFEAFVCQLFERWCLKEYPNQVGHVFFLDGRGGDGGVEGFAVLHDGTEVGVQAKWFREGFGRSQARQVMSSIAGARKRHKRLVRYVVCFPMALKDSKDEGRGQKSQLDHWWKLLAWAKTEHPGLQIDYWGNKELNDRLVEPGSDDLRACWFEQTVITIQHLQDVFQRTRDVWFKERYLPDLHCVGMIDSNLQKLMLERSVRAEWLHGLSAIADATEASAMAIQAIFRISGPKALDDEQRRLAEKSKAELQQLGVHIALLQRDLQHGSLHSSLLACDARMTWETKAVPQLLSVLIELDSKSIGYAPSHQCRIALGKLQDLSDTLFLTLRGYQGSFRPLAIIGAPGTGKTHGVLAYSDRRIQAGLPVVVIPARDTDPSSDWASILGRRLDRPAWSAERILLALEAAAYHAERSKPGRANDHELPAGSCRALIVIDGLEESANSHLWCERLGELCAMLHSRPRIALAVTTRTSTEDECLGTTTGDMERTQVNGFSDSPLPEIFDKYCDHYRIRVEERPWLPCALRTPLAIKMFARVYENKVLAVDSSVKTTLPGLLEKLIEVVEAELRVSVARKSSRDKALAPVPVFFCAPGMALSNGERKRPVK